ncbi:hypothetical protein OH76DRAFT_192689 [Lentinus brumalis]|uniref:Uncharacterized protein n=1 Tax=Lentinus brumalis TaxID=2498619 RepID=A0A371CMU2_9APHY|nr:hypothetical protein OH76DRAFT_192689 [Polyporus brumalis]
MGRTGAVVGGHSELTVQDVTSFPSPVINPAPAIIPRAHRVSRRAATCPRCPSPQYNLSGESVPCTTHPAGSEANNPLPSLYPAPPRLPNRDGIHTSTRPRSRTCGRPIRKSATTFLCAECGSGGIGFPAQCPARYHGPGATRSAPEAYSGPAEQGRRSQGLSGS